MTKGVFIPGKAPKTELCLSIVSILATQHGEKRASHQSLIILSTHLQVGNDKFLKKTVVAYARCSE